MSATFSYRVCGLSLTSDAPIAGLHAAPIDGRCDVTVSMGGQGRAADGLSRERASISYASPERDECGSPLLTVWSSPDGYLLQYSEGALFQVDPHGGSVEAQWAPPLTEADAATYLLGPVLAFVLRLRGTVPLHASGVAIDGRGVLFVGEAGAGKSSTAAAFATLGYPVLSDDIVSMEFAANGALAYPSYPRLSVWPDSAEALLARRGALPFHSASYRKPYLDVLETGYRFQQSPVPVDTIYVLHERSAVTPSPSSMPMAPRAALLALVRNTYCGYLLDAAMRAREFDALSLLVTQVSVRELSFGDSLEQLVSGCVTLATAVRSDDRIQP